MYIYFLRYILKIDLIKNIYMNIIIEAYLGFEFSVLSFSKNKQPLSTCKLVTYSGERDASYFYVSHFVTHVSFILTFTN